MSDPLEEARRVLETDYDEAVRLLRPLAEAGEAEAQFLLGELYFLGWDDVDEAESRTWLEKAAAQQHAEAAYHLTWLIAPETEDSRTLLQRAAEWGSLGAQRALGCSYALGEDGWPQDLSLARTWYRRAAEAGHADAQYNYAMMLMDGEGGPVDPA